MHRKLDYIDSLRGIAALIVILVHCGERVHVNKTVDAIVGMGAKGVQLFFFISAFTLFLSYNIRKTREVNVKTNFYIRRYFRIAPLYYSAILIYSLIHFFSTRLYPPPDSIFLNVFFLHDFSPRYINNVVPGGWSIGVEMLFYLSIPFLIFLISNLNRAFFFLVFCLIARYVLLKIFQNYDFNVQKTVKENFLYWNFFNQLQCFAFGILFYFLQKELFNKKLLSGMIVFFLFVLITSISDIFFFNKSILNNDFYVLLFLLVSILVLSYKPIKLIVNKVTVYLGTLSFSMYINHFFVLFFIVDFPLTRLNYFHEEQSFLALIMEYSLVVILTIVISELSYKYIETKGILLGNKIIHKLYNK